MAPDTRRSTAITTAVLVLTLLVGAAGSAAERRVRVFQRLQLSDEYYAEGAGFGDLNRDGKADVVAGPYWYAGPEFTSKHEIYPPKPQNRNRYADNFFSFVWDFNSDGWDDVLVVGFPGTPANWYENPRGEAGHWSRHEVFDWVSNESPHFTDLVGDGWPELVCTRQGHFVYVTVNRDDPTAKWSYTEISGKVASERFGHGLGVGDVDGDGRRDVLAQDGWFRQPADPQGKWDFHAFVFARAGGAQMLVYDVDGDGDSDVITSLQAHDHGLAWYESVREGEEINFHRHLIMGSSPAENRYGVVFSELHALALADMDGDGLKDIVTGRCYWSHHARTPSWHDGAVVYWFRLVRSASGVDWVPYQADDDSGVGRQVEVGDLNGDGLQDIVSANMKGTFVLRQNLRPVRAEEWLAAQPRPYTAPPAGHEPDGMSPVGADGKPLDLGFESGTLAGWTATGDAFAKQPVRGEIDPNRPAAKNAAGVAKTAKPSGEYWIGGYETAFTDKGVGTLASAAFVVSQPWASFRVGGGCELGIRVELVHAASGAVVFKTHGRRSERMFPEVVDLTAVQGEKIFVRLVDESSAGYGHLNFDDFRLHAKQPDYPDRVAPVKRAVKPGS